MGKVLPYFTKKFGGDTKVGGYLHIRQAVNKRGVMLNEMKIPFFRRGTYMLQYAGLLLNILMLSYYTKAGIKLGVVSIKMNNICPLNL